MAFDELKFVDWLRERCRRSPAVHVGIGDDMALLAAGQNQILVASDMLLDGVHFESGVHAYGAIGRKAIARNLSDCAAMAVKPLAATVSIAFPRNMDESGAQKLYLGMEEIADAFGLRIVGGDTATWSGPLAIDVTITAEPFQNTPPVLRSGAKPGDRLYVTGQLGGSLLGRHLTFSPRVREARQLAEHLGHRLHAMIDISDGLGIDLWRMCKASGVAARLDERQVLALASDDATQSAREDGRSVLEHVLGDGEDHELLLAVEGDASGAPTTVMPVGIITGGSELEMKYEDGRIGPIEPLGFIHR